MSKLTPLTDKEIDELTSYADGSGKVRRGRNPPLTFKQLTELALDANIEQCPTCRWWCESGELIPDGSDQPDRHCLNCREPEK